MRKFILILIIPVLFLSSCLTVSESDGGPAEQQSVTDLSGDASAEEQNLQQTPEVSDDSLQAEPQPGTWDDLPFPFLGANGGTAFELRAFLSGEVTEVTDDSLGFRLVAVKTDLSYLYQGRRSVEFEYIFGGLESVDVEAGDRIVSGVLIGRASAMSYMSARAATVDPYMLRMTQNKPLYYNGAWYFSPDWIIPDTTAWLSFRAAPSFRYSMMEYYHRLMGGGESSEGVILRNQYDLDRIRAKLVLESYPEPISDNSTVRLIEQRFFSGRSLYVLRSSFDDMTVEGYTPVLLWQHDFDTYLESEYTLGEDIYVYGSICAIDHVNREILVGVRDFSLKSDETIVNERMSELEM